MLAREPLPEGERDPIQVIEEPPDPSSAPNLASRNRNTTWMGGMGGAMGASAMDGEPEASMDPSAMDAPSATAPSMEAAATAMSAAPSENPTAARSTEGATASDG